MTSTQTSLLELEPAIVARLTGDTTLMAIVTGVFDEGAVPTNQPYPYIAIGDTTEGPWNAFQRRGYEATFMVHIWDNLPGFKRCQQILANTNRLLDQPQTAFALATQTHVGTWYDGAQTLNDPGLDDIRHMPVRYKFMTQEQ